MAEPVDWSFVAAMALDSPDLHRLSAAEREVLALLAAGHTAKSIATLTGRSEGAVNERLRDARRKTGVGSSRELARLLRQQENRDEEIGVALPGATDAMPLRPAGGRDRHLPKVVVMITLLTATGALLFGLSVIGGQPQAASPLPADPPVDAVVGSPDATPQAMHRRFLAEPRDPAWAAHAEAELAAAYRAIDGLAPDLRIRCARTLCEVVGRTKSGSEADVGRTMQALQGQRLMDRLSAAGLKSPATGFGGSSKASVAFVAYWGSTKP